MKISNSKILFLLILLTPFDVKPIDDLKSVSDNILKSEILAEDSLSNNNNEYYLLAMHNIQKNTPHSRTLAREFLRKAINIEPGNMELRIILAQLLESSFSASAEEEYNTVLSFDPSNTNALLGIARISESEFYEWLNSVKLFEENIIIEFNDFAMEDFNKAESYLKNTLSVDSLNYSANTRLALLYESINKNEEAYFYLNRLMECYPDSFNVYLNAGLVLYKLSKIEEANKCFLTAFGLMPEEEKNEFTYSSVVKLLEPVIDSKLGSYSRYEIEDILDYYWNTSDPLLLTDYNERLIEHYARLVYSNLRFTPRNQKRGWKTDRGEVVLRYGKPENFMRIRPNVDWGAFNVKTEVWHYKNMTLGFTDTYSSGEYVFNIPSSPEDRVKTQFAGDTYSFINEFKREHHQLYVPKYEGPSFNVELNSVQFRNEKNKYKTDVYISYSMPDTVNAGHTYGAFLFDKYFEKIVDERKKIPESGMRKMKSGIINKVSITSAPVDGNLAFEILRDEDKGVSSNHGTYKVKDFSSNKLLISDLLLASETEFEKGSISFIERKNINLLPNPSNEFGKQDDIFIYFEVYNLAKGVNDYEFDQTFTLKNQDDEKFTVGKVIGSVLNFVGLQDNEESISVSSTIKSNERDTDIYLQLDLSSYKQGDYELIVKLTDKNSGQSVETKSKLVIK